jgi:hypothetical protein
MMSIRIQSDNLRMAQPIVKRRDSATKKYVYSMDAATAAEVLRIL